MALAKPPEPCVLIVDDQKTLLDLLDVALRRAKLDADTATGGEAAIECLGARHYKVLLLDLMMPVVSGWDVLDWLAEHRDRKPRTVIVITAADREVTHRLNPDVTNAIIFKPFDVFELSAYVKVCCAEGKPDRRRKRVVGIA